MAESEPTLEKFNTIMDAHLEMQNGLKEFKQQNKASSYKAQSQNSRPKDTNNPLPKLTEDERKRRKFIQNKYYRCGSSDHMMPACKLSPNISCNTCKAQGHISPVCLKAVARVVTQDGSADHLQYSHQLALTYDPSQQSSPGYYATTNPVHAMYGLAHNMPTPELLL